MKDESKSRKQLLEELHALRRRVSDLEKPVAELATARSGTGQGEFEYQTLFDNIPQKIFFKDTNSVYLRVNPSFAGDFGVSPDGFVGKTDFDFFPRAAADKYRADDKRIMLSGGIEEWDEEYTCQGETRTVHTLKAPARDADGHIIGVFGIFWDITERKMVEARLQKEINFTNTLIHASPAFFVTMAPDGKTLLMNQSMLNAVGYGIEEVAGKDYLLNFVPETEREGISSFFKELLTSHTSSSRNHVLTRDGRQLLVEWVGRTIITATGEPEYFFGVGIDITEREANRKALKESENKFRNLAEKSSVGVYLIQDDLFRYVNPCFAEIHGYPREEIVDRKGPLDSIFPDDIPALKESLRKRLTGEIESANDEFRIVTRTGEIRNVEIYGSGTTYRGRHAVVGSLIDITDRKRNERALYWETAFLKALVDSSHDGILVLDSQRRKVHTNQRMVDLWKIPTDVVGSVNSDDSEATIRYLMDHVKDPEGFFEKVAYLYRHPDETVQLELETNSGIILDVYSSPVIGKDDEHYGRIWGFRDITEVKQYWKMLETLSTTDGLTGIANRRRFDTFLDQEWRRNMRDETPLSLILMDIDFFKQFNDHYGHLAGDDCLRRIADTVNLIFRRPGDLVARYGGEEFACVLPNTHPAGAVDLGDRIRKAVEETDIPHLYSSVASHVTVSLGVATLIPKADQPVSGLIQLSDELLYSAKQHGRNQVRSWPLSK
jgi:diguanylate cyclase (GGDEF)-like protein/PAS domain S-box-containing protein